MDRIKAVIFDIDGTVYDYALGNRLGLAALEDYGRRVLGVGEETLRGAVKQAEEELGGRLSGTAASHNRLVRIQRALELLNKPPFPHALRMAGCYWNTLLDSARPFPGLIDCLCDLKEKGFLIGAGSNMTALLQYKKLERLGAAPFIHWILTSEEAGTEKPDPRFFKLCAEKSGCRPQECLFIGDSLKHDVLGARTAGMESLLFDPETGDIRDYRSWREQGYPGIF